MMQENDGPHNGRLNNIFAILIDGLQHVTRLCLYLRLDWLIQIHADLL